MRVTARGDAGVARSLWLAHAALRLAAGVEAVVVVALDWGHYRHPAAAIGLAAGYAALAVALSVAYPVVSQVARRWLVGLDVAATVAVVALSLAVSRTGALDRGLPTLPLAGLAGPVLAAAIVAGAAGGLLAGAAVAAADVAVHLAPPERGGSIGGQLTGIVTQLLFAGAVGGMLSRSALCAEAAATEAEGRARAAAARTELAAEVHDHVLSGLALIARDASRLEPAEVSALAGRAEARLRDLVRTRAAPRPGDLVAAVSAAVAGRDGPPAVTLALPAVEILRPAAVVDAVLGALGAALDNVAIHAAGSPAWVGAAMDGDELCLWIRDEGPGVDAERLASAAAQGRLGVALSIRGRMEAVGARADVRSGPGGTEVQLRV